MNKRNILVKIVTDNYYKLLLKINSIGVNIYDIEKYKKYVILKVDYEDYLRLKKYLVTYKISIYSELGINKILLLINRYKVYLISVFIAIILLLFTNTLIFKIEINTENDSIKTLVANELEKHGLKVLRLKKDHTEIEKIVSKILDENDELIEWLEIKYDGVIMVVEVVEKVSFDKEEDLPYCNIIASKDALITSLNIYRGVPLKEVNDYVLKGDIILSGDVLLNEEVKNKICAEGHVYGEVWYKVKIEVPFKTTYKEYTGKNRYNFNVKINDDTYKILKSRIDVKEEKFINLYKLDDFEINLVKEKEYVEKVKTIDEKEAYNKAISLVEEKINLVLEEDEEILDKKVLKNMVNDSKIYLEVFVVTKENIGELQIPKEEVKDGI